MKIINCYLSLIAAIFTLNAGAVNPKDTLSSAPKRYMSMILAQGTWAINTTSVGVRYCGALQLKKYPRLGVGPIIGFEALKFNTSTIKLPANVKEASVFILAPTLNIQYRFNKIITSQLGVSILFGTESKTIYYYENTNTSYYGPPKLELRERKTEESIGGIQLEQNVFYQPLQKTGITIGVGLFERSVSASFYDTDFGARAYLGFFF